MKPETSRWVPVLIWVTVFGLGCWFAITSTRIQSQLSLLLPSDGSPAQRLLVEHLNQGSISRLILIGLKGGRSDTLAKASILLASIMKESGNFTYVRNGDVSQSMLDYDLLYQYRYLLSPTIHPDQFRTPTLRKTFEHRLHDLTSPLPPFIKSRIPHDPTGEFLKILGRWTQSTSLKRHAGVWFSSDGQYALIAAETTRSGFDLEAQEQLQQEIKDAVSHIKHERLPNDDIQLVMTGAGVFAVESRAAIKKEAQWLSILATILVIGFLFATYRSFRLVYLSVVPLASGLLAGVIVVNVVHGFIHGITLAFGTTLIGVAIDYPIHVFSHSTPHTSPTAVLGRIWPIMRLGALTTAMGYGAILFSGFPGLSQLGLFAIVGLLTAAIVTKWILPSLMPMGFEVIPFQGWIVHYIEKLPNRSMVMPVMIAVTIISVVYLRCSEKALWEHDIANLSPIPQEFKQLDSWFRNELGAPTVRDVMVVMAPTEQETLEQTEGLVPILDRLVRQGFIAGYDMVTRYLPSAHTQRQRQAALPDPDVLAKYVTQAQKGLSFKPDVFRGFVQDVAAAKHQPPLDSQGIQNTALGSKISSLLFHRNGQWVAMVPLQEVTERTPLISVSTEHKGANLHYLDLKDASNRMVTLYRNEVMTFLSFGAVAIMVLLLLVLRSPSTVLRVVIPVGCAALTVVAVLHLFDERLSLFHVASLLLVAGIGLDYALFFNREYESKAEREQTIMAILVCSGTTMMVFGLLACSQTPILHSIGITAALGAFCCLLFSAMLARPNVTTVSRS